ncbi:MAG: aldo/keto reductase [Phycisphaerae bacterium]|nr:aldo/keto reductase [Phycisphaerae bacterium]
MSEQLNRRDFLNKSMRVSAGIVVGGAGSRSAHSALTKEEMENAARIGHTRSYNPKMEYRRLGKTGLWVSAVCLGGHWKRIDKVIGTGEINPYNAPTDKEQFGPFMKNREDVIHYCLEQGINCIDLAGDSEAEVYCRALGKSRDKIYLAYSHPASELRVPDNRKADKLLDLFKAGLKRCNIEYADIWRLMALERGGQHSQAEVEAMMTALTKAREQGLCRYTGLSTHDRKWAEVLIKTYPDIVQVVVTPYTAKSKVLPRSSFFKAVQTHDVGILGIKPFASNSLFIGDGSPDNPNAEEDDRRARMATRYILNNPAITAPIPGLISTHQVDNMVLAVKERRELDLVERAELETIGDEMYARLPAEYQWLKDWEYV